MIRERHALKGARLAQRPWPLQLLTDRLGPRGDLFELFSLTPGPILQHGTDFPELLSRGLKPKFSLGNIETYPQDFRYLTLIIANALVGPEYPDFLTVAQHVLIDTEGIAIGVALQPIQKAGQISVFEPGSACQYGEHRFAYDLLGRISEKIFRILIDRSDFAFGVQAQKIPLTLFSKNWQRSCAVCCCALSRGDGSSANARIGARAAITTTATANPQETKPPRNPVDEAPSSHLSTKPGQVHSPPLHLSLECGMGRTVSTSESNPYPSKGCSGNITHRRLSTGPPLHKAAEVWG
jgi:hypothetical protein